jgi:outer membrane cobalamin receptor
MFFEEVNEDRSHRKDSLGFQLAGLYSPAEEVSFRASASRKTRFPTLKELFSSQWGNPDLDTMKAYIYEAGMTYLPRDDVSISFVGFFNGVEDLIDRVTKDQPYLNVDRAEFKGVEASLEWTVNAKADLHFSYTRLDAKDLTSEDRSYIQNRPKNKFDFTTHFYCPSGFRIDFMGSFVSSQVFYDDDGFNELDGYGLVDIGVTKKLHHYWDLYFRARNFFDVLYYESDGYPMEGGMIYGGVRFTK